jgi:hypothetical protein
MSCRQISRRDFSRRVLLGTAAALSLEDRHLLAKPTEPAAAAKPAKPAPLGTLPTGKIGDLELSRLIMGGNLIGGFAHSRDLMYVSPLLKHYFTPEKVLETLELAEQHGINCVNTNPGGAQLIQRYWKERGGKIKWMVQGNPNAADNFASLKALVDAGADTIYIQGNEGDKLSRDGNADLLGKAFEFIKANGLPAGIAGHELRTPMFVEKAGLAPDYYVKTLHGTDYWSTRRPGQDKDIIDNYGVDNYWCKDPDEVTKYMAGVKRPWIAYKVMAAGAIKPRAAFKYAFEHGADFILAGIFDFQVAEDAQIAREVLAKVNRARPWMA